MMGKLFFTSTSSSSWNWITSTTKVLVNALSFGGVSFLRKNSCLGWPALRHVARRHYSPVCGQCLRVQFDPYKMRLEEWLWWVSKISSTELRWFFYTKWIEATCGKHSNSRKKSSRKWSLIPIPKMVEELKSFMTFFSPRIKWIFLTKSILKIGSCTFVKLVTFWSHQVYNRHV